MTRETRMTITLYELNRLVREAIESEMPNEYWVEAELSECRENRGHCYMELIQKDELSATPVAKASAKCWASKWLMVRPYFERITGQRLVAGMKVLLKVYAQFHEAYGFSWIVNDIDPTYTLGNMARKRQEIINQLKAEGVFDLQKDLPLPIFCQRIAVISSETAAGYGDFCNQLADNPYGFKFQTQLFPATMQGESIERSIIEALNSINAVCDDYDAVVIIRGGGATSDMAGFDTLALAENVANFPIPIITGIGHDRDESILDMVSHTRVKTPTAAAAFLIDHLKTVSDQLTMLSEAIPRLFSVVRTHQEARLDNLYQRILMRVQQRAVTSQADIRNLEQGLLTALQRRLTSERHLLEMLEEKVRSLDPALLLKRGYSMTLFNGKAVRDPQKLRQGDEIETRLEKGTIKSIIK